MMNDYVAVVHLSDTPPATRCWPTEGVGPGVSIAEAVQDCRDRLAGIREARLDPACGALTIRFDRDRVNIADVVRFFEDRGVTVVGVAQSRAMAPAAAAD